MKTIHFGAVVILLALVAGSLLAQTSTQNYIISRSFPSGKDTTGATPKDSLVSITYYDGLGREFQTQTLSDTLTKVIVSSKFYDSKGRPISTTKPFQTTRDSFKLISNSTLYGTFSGTGPATGQLSAAFGGDTSAYERLWYLNEPADRISSTMPFGKVYHANNHYTTAFYGTDPFTKTQFVLTRDEDGDTNKAYSDFFGNKVMQVTEMEIDSNNITTYFEYDVKGNLIKTISPLARKNLTTSNSYQEVRLTGGTGIQTLRFDRPQNALDVTVTLSYRTEFHPDDPDLKQCGSSLTMEYRIFSRTQVTAWQTVPGNNKVLQLSPDQTAVEVRKTNLQILNSPPGCWPLYFWMTMSTTSKVFDPLKYSTTYKYNSLNQLVQKYSPDEDTVKYIYNKAGQLRFVQDKNHRSGLLFAGQTYYWTFFKYDSLGRVIKQGEYKLQTVPQDSVDGIGAYTACGITSFPSANLKYTIENYYDYYKIIGSIGFTGFDTTKSGANPRGKLTQSKVFDPDSSNHEEAFFYDKYGRIMRKIVYNPYLKRQKKIEYDYDPSGRLLKLSYQKDSTDSYFQWFVYDKLSRLDTSYSGRYNHRDSAKCDAVYDYINNYGGKVQRMKYGTNIDTALYSYSIRDWLTQINAGKFDLTLGYDDASAGSISPARYDGNIRALRWQVLGQVLSGYDYYYDKGHRLTDANFQNQNKYSERLLQYDLNGNIQRLYRHNNSSSGDSIKYFYDSNKKNRLNYTTGVVADSFYYDGNGNTTRDKLRGNFEYDYRNMLIKAHLNSGKKNIFGYDASGQRVDFIRRNLGGTILDSSRIFILGVDSKIIAEYVYVSGAWKVDHYNLYANELVGKFAPTTGNNGNRYYYEKDHLGSVRVVVNESKNIESWTDFYPYGKESRSSSSINEPTENFTGHQLDIESSMLYAGARYYDNQTGRFISVDPLTKNYPSLSPFVYAANNPSIMVDPDGKKIEFFGAVRERTIWNSVIGRLKESATGRALYEKLDSDPRVFSFRFGVVPQNMSGKVKYAITSPEYVEDAAGVKVLTGTKTVISRVDIESSWSQGVTLTGATSHEMFHVDQMVMDLQAYLEFMSRFGSSYEDNPVEQSAMQFEIQVLNELKNQPDNESEDMLSKEGKEAQARNKSKLQDIEKRWWEMILRQNK